MTSISSSGADCVRLMPPGRWSDDGLGALDAKVLRRVQFGGFLDDIDSFDKQMFRLSPADARTMDPQQRLLLELLPDRCSFCHCGGPGQQISHRGLHR